MADSTRERMANRLRTLRDRESYRTLFACTAVVIAALVAVVFMRHARAMNRVETILDCHCAGNVAHTHTVDCYDQSGTLVCPLQERPLHVHDQSCYTETKTLVCGMKEGQKLKDGTVHKHTDDCYEVARTLTCGLDEATTEHVHGPGCFLAVSGKDKEAKRVDIIKTSAVTKKDELPTQTTKGAGDEAEGGATEEDAAALQVGKKQAGSGVAAASSEGMPAQTFEEELLDDNGSALVRATVEAPEGAFPAHTTMRVRLIDSDEARTAVEEAAKARTGGRIDRVQLVDITFFDEAGDEVEPLEKVTVKLASDLIAQSAEPMVVQVDHDGTGNVVDTLDNHELELRNESAAEDELAFDASK